MATFSLDDYKAIVGEQEIAEIEKLASWVKGASIVHINSTRFGGGVAELLKNMVPLARTVGLNVSWQVMEASSEFFNVTKKFHNALQGMPLKLTEAMKKVYLEYNRLNAEKLDFKGDLIMVHDPQPAALLRFRNRGPEKWVWRCHIDLTKANPVYWDFLKPFVLEYDGLVFSLQSYIKEDLRNKHIFLMPPSINPLSEKNKPISESQILKMLEKYEVSPEKPILTQVARFDPWKDPLGVIDVYRLVKREIPQTQLLLVGSMAADDPEGDEWLKKTVEKAGGDKDIHILTDREGVGDLEVNAFQRASTVVIQKSLREGFGLSVTEALWKGTPVVATRTGGIPLQVLDGVTGFLVDTVEAAAEKVTLIIKRPYLGRMLGTNGRDHVRRNFLITRHLKDYLKIHLELIE
ncbi:glycosyltransferase [Candidatus Hecatella orcuttiae]|jgi:trehalose synthase|uniref:glycosyltransferase n=1 Tax=Candidatus Hecatella orcuttiae TaxID=1935119 RepID=UPI002868160F|nr:glycosyltransferase [Candidatus Hecatella orcuttiae]